MCHKPAIIFPILDNLEVRKVSQGQRTSTVLPHAISEFASLYTDTNVALHMIITTDTNTAIPLCIRDDDPIPRCKRSSVMKSKQNVKGPKKTTFDVEKGPCRDIIRTLCVSNAITVVVERNKETKLG